MLETPKIGQRWRYTRINFEKLEEDFIFEVIGFSEIYTTCKIIQVFYSKKYSDKIGRQFHWSVGCDNDWYYLKGQDKIL